MKRPTLTRNRQLLILLGITIGGAFLRLYQLGSLPPGDGYDVAQYGVDALEILAGARPIFLPANFGREVLFSYLVAVVYLLTGPGTFGIHLASALVGIAAIPAVFWAAYELLADEKGWLRDWGPLLAALVTAVSYWHLNWSRVGLRVIWVPLFAALIVASVWHGLRTKRRLAFVGAGLLLGLSLYTYQAARLLPLVVTAAFVIWAIAEKRFTRQDGINFLLTVGFALLVFAPLGFYALRHPAIFNDRVWQTAVVAGENDLAVQVQAVVSQSITTLRMFGVEGDQEAWSTIPGRPSLNPFLFAAFLLGMGVSVWRWQRPTYLLLLIWLGVMTLPAMVAGQAGTAKRALGAYPAVAILIAVGLLLSWQIVWEWAYRANWQSRRWGLALVAVVIVGGLVWGTAVTYRDYFILWGQDETLANHFQRDHTEVGRYIGQLPADETVLVSPFPVSHPAIQLHSHQHPKMRSYNGHFCMLYPADDQNGISYVIVPGVEEKSLETLRAAYAEGELLPGPARPDMDAPYYNVYTVPPSATLAITPQHPLEVTWENKIRLLGFDLERTEYRPGETIELSLYYQALVNLDESYTAFVQLLGEPDPNTGNPLWGQADNIPCHAALATNNWQRGDIIRDTITLDISGEAVPGSYSLATGFYTWPDIVRLKTQFAGAYEQSSESVELRTIQVLAD